MKQLILSKVKTIIGENSIFLYDLEDKGIHIKIEALEKGCFTSTARVNKGSDFRVVVFGTNNENETNFDDERCEFLVNLKKDGTIKFKDDSFFDCRYVLTKRGDFIQITNSSDDDLNEWEDAQDNCNFEVEIFCNESELVWVKNCNYAIPMSNVFKIRT